MIIKTIKLYVHTDKRRWAVGVSGPVSGPENSNLVFLLTDAMPPSGVLIGLLCLNQAGPMMGFARLLDDAELRSAFSAARTNSMEGGPKMTVTFDAVYVNIGGDFDPKAGLFRCRIPGAYFFSFTVGKFPHKDLSVMLMKNRNEVQAIVYEENAGEERKVSPLGQIFNPSFHGNTIFNLLQLRFNFQ